MCIFRKDAITKATILNKRGTGHVGAWELGGKSSKTQFSFLGVGSTVAMRTGLKKVGTSS